MSSKKPTIASLQLELNQLRGELVNERAMRAADLRLASEDKIKAEAQYSAMATALNVETKLHNETRDILHSTELELAKMRGYLEAHLDTKPPVMVAEQREPFHARLSDATRSLSVGGWKGPGNWWHK